HAMLYASIMTLTLRSMLFALVLPACGGHHEAQTVTPKTESSQWIESSLPAPVVEPTAAVEPQTKPDSVKVAVAAVPTSFDDAMKQGRALAEKGEHSGAVEMFEAAIKLDGKKAEPHMELARVHIALGAKAQAVIEANKAVKLAPSSSQAWNTKGRA